MAHIEWLKTGSPTNLRQKWQTGNHLAEEVHSARLPQASLGSVPFVIFSLLEQCIKSLLIKFVDDIKVKNNDSLVLQTEQNYLVRLDFSEQNPF